jgi:thymidylate synthase
MELISNDIDLLYKDSLNEILQYGIVVTARGLTFKEIRFQHLILTNPRSRIVGNSARKLSKRFMAAEFVWIMTSNPWLDMISFYNKNYAQFSDDGISLHGAYGPRLRHWGEPRYDLDQLENCLQRLKNDIYTRQAVIVILDPALDFTIKTKDVPCNNYLHFMYREGKLDLMCYVRSNDFLLGFPYDIHHWCMLQEMFASILNVEVGDYHHIVGSMHIYTPDIPRVEEIIRTPTVFHEMEKMPKLDDLKVIDEMKIFEKNYREKNEIDFSKFNDYWKNYLALLIKK